MPDSPRYVLSDISVSPDGQWYSGKSKIENASILQFFKKNLHSDINGVFIFNEFGMKSEKAYIKVRGPLLKVTGIQEDQFILDTQERLDIAGKEIAMDSQGRMYIVLEKLKGWAVFTRQATDDMRERLAQKDGQYFWNDRPIRVIKEFPWFFG